MSNKVFKAVEVCIEQFGKENVLKMFEGLSKEQLFDSLFQDKPQKSSEMSEKMRKVVEARWAKKRESTTTETKVDTKVDTKSEDENDNKISVSYENDTRDVYENSIQKVDTETVYEEPVQKEDTKEEEYVQPKSVHTEQDLINVAESVDVKPAVQAPPSASYSELQAQLSKFEAAAEDVMNTNDPFTIKAFRSKLDAWYKGAGAGAVEFIGDVNFLTQQLVAKLAELTEKEKNNG